jgi:hypothetical protein
MTGWTNDASFNYPGDRAYLLIVSDVALSVLRQQLTLAAGSVVSISVLFGGDNIRDDVAPVYGQVTLAMDGVSCGTYVITYDNTGQTFGCSGVTVNENPTIQITVYITGLDFPGQLVSGMWVTDVNVSPVSIPCPGDAPYTPPTCVPVLGNNIVGNPGFESASLLPWSTDSIPQFIPTNAPGGDPGAQSFEFDFPAADIQSIQQQLTLPAGSQVIPSFWYITSGLQITIPVAITVSFGREVWATVTPSVDTSFLHIGPDDTNAFLVKEANPVLTVSVNVGVGGVQIFLDNFVVTPVCSPGLP